MTMEITPYLLKVTTLERNNFKEKMMGLS